MKMDFSTVAFYNPWWDEKSKSTDYAFHLVDKYESSSFKRDYNGLFDLSGNNLYIVRGPRQIGKSTLLKFTIANLLKSGERRSVLYLPLDTISRADELRSLLIQYLQFSRNEKKRYIFIDEITMVDQWQCAVKEVRDNTEMAGDFFALSGSSASDLKRSSERLPGRKGQSGADILLLPLTFREYLSCKKVDGLPKCQPEDILKMVPADSFELLIKNEILKTEFFNYIASGGFPSAVEAYAKGESRETLVRTFWEILIGNIERYGLSRAKLIQILTYVSTRLSSRFSWNSAASETEIDTKTFQKYVEVLGIDYLLLTLKHMDQKTHLTSEKKQKKIYYCDRLISDVVSQKLGLQLDRSAILENIMTTNCVFAFGKNLDNGLDSITEVGYWYSKEGKEIDLLVKNVPIELKYQNSIIPQDLSTIKRHFKKGIILSKHTLDLSGDIKILPLHIFLAITGE